jgi:hypothetical protein
VEATAGEAGTADAVEPDVLLEPPPHPASRASVAPASRAAAVALVLFVCPPADVIAPKLPFMSLQGS